MKTPIIDFVNQYKEKKGIRLHMPGHKGNKVTGPEAMDITEIDGADALYTAEGIIRESERNASELFGADTYYSAEGSSLAIRAMLFLAMTKDKHEGRPVCLAARNVHKTFVTAASLLDFDVKWVYAKASPSYHTCKLTASDIEETLEKMEEKPFAVYLTSPDYLGYISDIKGIAGVCRKYGVPLLVDNAHGAYLKFLKESLHPMDLGATMCCDSAHKTFPALTGAAYLHIADSSDPYYHLHAKEALSMFGSTSPSYLILESLDMCNTYIHNSRLIFQETVNFLSAMKEKLISHGYVLTGDEPMKLSFDAKSFGYTGHEMAEYLMRNNITPEFHDQDFLVLMPSTENRPIEMNYVLEVLLALPKKPALPRMEYAPKEKKSVMSIREASFSRREKIKVSDAEGRILADTAVTCPPAVPVVVCGEEITGEDIRMFEYYGVEECSVVDK